jgi:hypothetical protein
MTEVKEFPLCIQIKLVFETKYGLARKYLVYMTAAMADFT